MKLLGRTKSRITKDNVLHLHITDVILVYYNIVNNNHQHDSEVFYAFITNKSCYQLLDISTNNFIFLKTFN